VQNTQFGRVNFEPLGLNLLKLFVSSNFEISAPECSTHSTPDGKGDVLDIVVHQNIRLSEVTATQILDSDQLRIMFIILETVRTRQTLDPIEKLMNWELSKPLH
jgi:hypothetical protein